MSTTLAEQLDVPQIKLTKLLTVQLATQGSHSKVNFGTKVQFAYEDISVQCYFDIMNVQNYNIILGTPFLFQHKIMVGLNGSHVIVGSKEPLPIKGDQVQVLESDTAESLEEWISEV